MDKLQFAKARKQLGKTQKQLSILLGVSLKAVHSYEQGWRSIPGYIERQLYFLIANQRGSGNSQRLCWEIKNCECKEKCPAWEFQAGHLCWFISGTLCDCTADLGSRDKIEVCRECEVLSELL
ncbi:MAG: helix-turn-helix domain-containing protein [Desulfurivibrionaceae bacterium]